MADLQIFDENNALILELKEHPDFIEATCYVANKWMRPQELRDLAAQITNFANSLEGV